MASVFNLKLTAPLSRLAGREAFIAAVRKAGGTIAAAGKEIPWVSVFAEDEQAIARIQGVLFIEPDSGCDQCVAIASSASGSNRMDPWHLRMIGAPEAWKRSRGSGARIATIDTGFAPHNELRGAHITGESFVPTEGPYDLNGHGLGTHGLIAGQGPVVFGVAPEAEIFSLKALDKKGRGRWAWIALAVERAAELKCGVAVMALGGDGSSAMLEDALALFASGGGVAVAAAGNDSAAHLDYPGSSAYVVAAAAVDRDGKHPSWSSSAPWPGSPDVAAPGVDVPSLSMRGYKTMSGSSISTAIVGGILALRKLPADLAKSRKAIHDAAEPLARREETGFGLLSAARYASGGGSSAAAG